MIKILRYPFAALEEEACIADRGELPHYDDQLVWYACQRVAGVSSGLPHSVDYVAFDETVDEEHVAGFSGTVIQDDSWDAGNFDFHVFVHPAHRGGTLGYRLVKEVMAMIPPDVEEFETTVIHPTMTQLLVRVFGFHLQDEYHRAGRYLAELKWTRGFYGNVAEPLRQLEGLVV